jgi:hypothetical protein
MGVPCRQRHTPDPKAGGIPCPDPNLVVYATVAVMASENWENSPCPTGLRREKSQGWGFMFQIPGLTTPKSWHPGPDT